MCLIGNHTKDGQKKKRKEQRKHHQSVNPSVRLSKLANASVEGVKDEHNPISPRKMKEINKQR